MRAIEGIVIHRGEADFSSYHLVVHRDGSVERMHHDAEVAYHAGTFNASTIGICVEGDFCPGDKAKHSVPSQAQLEAVVALCRALRSAYGEHVWVDGHTRLGPRATAYQEKLTYAFACPGAHFPLAQVRTEVGAPEFPQAYTGADTPPP